MRYRDEALDFALSFPDSYKDVPFKDTNWQLVRVRTSKKTFLWTYERDGLIHLNVKVDPEWRDFWRSAYASVLPGWHLNKEHWNTIILDGSIPRTDIERMIAESYDIVTDSPAKRIYAAVKEIPEGKVATYQQIAWRAGNKNMSRAVGNALRKCHDLTVPCHRVLNAKGELSGAWAFDGAYTQAQMLMQEGVEVKDDKVDLKKYMWQWPEIN